MRVEVLGQRQLYRFLSSHLPHSYFRMYMHILTNPYLNLLLNLPRPVREVSEIYLDGEKYKINNYAVRKLWSVGYNYVYYVNKLHSKVIILGSRPDYVIVGSSNLSERSFSNLELIVLIEKPTQNIMSGIESVLLRRVDELKFNPVERMKSSKE